MLHDMYSAFLVTDETPYPLSAVFLHSRNSNVVFSVLALVNP